jgi:hypothetical protein
LYRKRIKAIGHQVTFIIEVLACETGAETNMAGEIINDA